VVELAGDSPEGLLAARELTAVTFAYTHAINVALAAAYVSERQAIASQSERARRDLIDHLLRGGGADAENTRRAEALGLRVDVPHVVVVAIAPEGDDRLGLVEQALAVDDPTRSFTVARNDEAIALLPVYVRRGPAEVRAAVDRAAARVARRHDLRLRAGVSSVCDGLADVARGYAEARRALRHAQPGRAAALEEVPLVDYLAEHADDSAQRLIPAAASAIASDQTLAATLRAYADCDMNVARAAEQLVVHPNTVHYRLRRVAAATGRDPRRFADLTELLMALRLSERSPTS
jgi:sugar diacid utilization regulator